MVVNLLVRMVTRMGPVVVHRVETQAQVGEGSCPQTWVNQTATSQQIHVSLSLLFDYFLFLVFFKSPLSPACAVFEGL